MSLREDIKKIFREEMTFEEIWKKAGNIVKSIVDNSNVALFESYFGKTAYEYYLGPLAFQENLKLYKDEDTSRHEQKCCLEKYYITLFMQACFNYACYRGNLSLIKYLIESQQIPGDLNVFHSEIMGYVHTNIKVFRGGSLKIAIRGGHLEIVQYLYEKTSVMIETTYGQPDTRTALMLSCKLDKIEIAEYLLKHGANPNAHKTKMFRNTTPLYSAFSSKNHRLIRLLVNYGAIVTSTEILQALRMGLDIDTINFLLLNSIENEDPYHPYLMAAISGGSIETFDRLEANSNIIPISEISNFDDKPIHHRMLYAALESGNLLMVKHVETRYKIDVKELLLADIQKQENHILSGKKRSDIQDISAIGDMLIYAAMEGDQRKNQLILLPYLFEDLNVIPSPALIQKLCSIVRGMRPIAYLFSHLPQHSITKVQLRSIALNLESLDLNSLFNIYNSDFVQNGNTYEKHGTSIFFPNMIAKLIGEKLNQVVFNIPIHDDEVALGAMFYLCREANDDSSMLTSLISRWQRLKCVSINNIRNCNGETLSVHALKNRSYNIVRILLMRGSDPDLPDNKGETLLAKLLDFDHDKNFNWVKSFISKITNSLKYACMQHFGGAKTIEKLLKHTNGSTHGLPLRELIDMVIATHNWESKLCALFTFLRENDARQLISLIRDEEFCKSHNISSWQQSSCLRNFEQVPEKKLSPESRNRRLEKTTLTPNTVSLAKVGTFAVEKSSSEQEKHQDQQNRMGCS